MANSFPFLTAYDPPGTSEGTLDPMGLYQIADQLAVQLVPAVRERMLRVRFLTAMAVGAFVTEDLDDDRKHRDASPYLIWEWLVVEAMVRTFGNGDEVRGVPGTQVAQRAIVQHEYLDARSYLKTPRIFGFHGVYKRLALHLGIVNVHLAPGPNAEALVDAWARDQGLGSARGAKPQLARWAAAIRKSLGEIPPRTRAGWGAGDWAELAAAFSPAGGKAREKRCLRDLLLATDDRPLGAFGALWQLQDDFEDDDGFAEEALHDLLQEREPRYAPLLTAIRSYESFARRLQDAFDLIRAEAARPDVQGFLVTDIARDPEFVKCVKGLHERYARAHRGLGDVSATSVSLQNLFGEHFAAFSDPLDPSSCAHALLKHHEAVQRAKSAEGKRPWFDPLGGGRIFMRHAYRVPRRKFEPGRYVHPYRGLPIRRFHKDLT